MSTEQEDPLVLAIKSVYESQMAIAEGFRNYSQSVAAETAALTQLQGRGFRRTVMGAIVIIISMLLIGTFWIKTIYDNSQTNKGIIASTQEATLTIKDCTDPEGECYKQTDERLATAVGKLVLTMNTNNVAARGVTLHRIDCLLDGGTPEACQELYPDPDPVVPEDVTTPTTVGG